MLSNATNLINETMADGFKPDPLLTVSEWADAHRYLSQSSSAEPGRWRTDRTPYLREIMDELSPSSPIEIVVLRFGVQLGKTETGNNFIGYIIDYAPGPSMFVTADKEMAELNMELRVDAMIESAKLQDKIFSQATKGDKFSRKTGKILHQMEDL